MAYFDDLPFVERSFLKLYRYRRSPWKTMARLEKPLSASRGALITTAALHLPGQEPFDESIRGGDWSYREIPDATDVGTLRTSHRSKSFDRAGLESDPNLALPLDRLHELAARGVIGPPNRRHFSFMGSIVAPGRLLRESGPEVADKLRKDAVDWVLLTPV
ncbi:MAG TPA: glycine/sarcosine/betaine reductase selenoprotein B family protein [Candidatus Polarisedimenticolia bacterium]|nr:glycine/sarcosine/betaine reductase selenoprotein B family protein [Candidatus Polarisedimenticolia bacterium]